MEDTGRDRTERLSLFTAVDVRFKIDHLGKYIVNRDGFFSFNFIPGKTGFFFFSGKLGKTYYFLFFFYYYTEIVLIYTRLYVYTEDGGGGGEREENRRRHGRAVFYSINTRGK